MTLRNSTLMLLPSTGVFEITGGGGLTRLTGGYDYASELRVLAEPRDRPWIDLVHVAWIV
jgi:hypothetical protein